MKKKSLIFLSIILSFVFIMQAACSSVPGSGKGVLKIGMPLPLTGVVAEQAKEMANSFNLYLEQHGNKLGGIPVEVFIEDTEADASIVVTKTRKVIENDKVHFVAGAALAFESTAMQNVTTQNKMALVVSMSSADDITQRTRSDYTVRLAMTSSQPNLAFGEYAYKELGYKKIAIVAQDYAYGWESAGGFQTGFEASGGTIVQKVWAPIDTADYGPFVGQIDKNVDAVYAILCGANVPRFIKTYSDFGLKAKIPLIGGPDIADEDALRYMGDEALDIIICHNYNIHNKQTLPYVEAYEKKFNKTPSYWGESTYTTAMWIDRTIDKMIKEGKNPNDIPDWIRKNPIDFIKAIKSIELPDAARGALKLDSYNSVVEDVYYMKVVKKDGKLYSEVIKTIPNVGQFWTYDPAAFLKNPVFSRDFPPLKK